MLTGLPQFVRPIAQLSQQFAAEQKKAIALAEAEMCRNGIVAVGDISNGDSTFEQKSKGKLRYYTFIEIFASFGPNNEARTEGQLELGQALLNSIPVVNGSQAALSPHAPYTVSAKLLHEVNSYNAAHLLRTSVHNQEAMAENDFFMYGTGAFADLYAEFGVPILQFFTPTGQHSIRYLIDNMPHQGPLLLVHNTITQAEDIQYAKAAKPSEIYWCFCPNANMYIEGRLPDFDLFRREKVNIVVGTDSLASNQGLCILSELKTITRHAAHISFFSDLLRWATLNGALSLGFEKELGSLTVGKKPGLNLLSDIAISEGKLCQETKVRVLV